MKIEWIKVDGMMLAIDKDTGEVVSQRLDTLPLDYDVTECVSKVLEDFFGSTLNTTAQIKTETRGRKAKGIINPYASFFSNIQYNEDTGSSNMRGVLDNLVYSASTASTGNTKIPTKQLVNVMRLSNLSTKGIQSALGKRRIIKGEEAPKKRYCQDVLLATENLIKGIERHEERGSVNLKDGTAFSFEADSVAYERSLGVSNAILCPVEFTEGDKRVMRTLARAGDTQAVNDFIERVTAQSSRMIERIIGRDIPADSKYAYADLQAEFPFEPYEDDASYVTRKKEKVVTKLSSAGEFFEGWMRKVRMYN